MSQPMQPIVKDKHGTARFQQNAIVRFLLDAGPYDMNQLGLMPFTDDDFAQFAQLIGYSVSGYGELSYVSEESVAQADELAANLESQSHDTNHNN